MNDSRRERKFASLWKSSIALGAAALFFPTAGCVNGDTFRSAQANNNESQSTLVESDAVQASTVAETRAISQTSLVSATIPTAPVRPTIITLPPRADLTQQIADAPGPVLLDFYADWCGPCRKQSKILHEIEGAAAQSQTTIIKINVDNHRDLAQQLNVSGLPTLMMVNDGQVTERQTGLATKQRLASWMR